MTAGVHRICDMQFFGIVGLGVAAGVLFGLVQWGGCAAVCDVGNMNTPFGLVLHAFFGLMLGVLLAIAARVGSRPQRSVRSLVKPMIGLLVAMAVFALAAGVVGFMLVRSGNVMLPAEAKEEIPAAKWAGFQACALAHQASFNVEFIGGGMLIAWAWVSRKRWREPTRG